MYYDARLQVVQIKLTKVDDILKWDDASLVLFYNVAQ